MTKASIIEELRKRADQLEKTDDPEKFRGILDFLRGFLSVVIDDFDMIRDKMRRDHSR